MDGRAATPVLETDGLLLAPIRDGGVWEALRALRDGMRRMGQAADASFVAAITDEGRLVPGQHADASVLILAYRRR